MRVGLVGYGGMGRHHAAQTAANPALTLVAVADASPEARATAERDHGAPAFASLTEMLSAVEVDGVLIVAPTFLHRPLIEEAAAAGKHVFCEKPLCLRPEEAPEVAAAVERAGITFGFGLVLRYMPAYTVAREIIARSDLGPVLLAQARYGAMFPATSYALTATVGGGLLNEHTIHMIDALEFLLGPTEAVTARLSRVEGRETEDNAAILFHFAGGVGATLAGSGTTHFPSVCEITGTSGEIAITYNTTLERVTAEGRRPVDLPEAPDPYQAEVEEWRQAVAEGRTPRTGLGEALRISAVLAAIHASARAGETVRIGA